MSSGCTLINESNYAAYDASYNTFATSSKPIGKCIDPNTKKIKTSNIPPGCSDSDFACYANHNLTMSRQKIDSNLQNIYQPQNSPIASFDENYQATMLTGVLWAALGTTVLYYGFTKI
jgi:hypothetical protein